VKVLDANGRAMELRTKLGEGGEGAVWASPASSALAIKTYLKPLPAAKAEKLQAMAGIADATLLAAAAWPTRVVYDTGRVAVGFEMPRLSGQKPLHDIIGTKSRMQAFPYANWQMLVHAAANLALAFSELHARNIVVGDVNSNNVVIGSDARVSFIDCDSFQIRTPQRTFRCEVGVPEYQPPELQAVAFGNVDRLPAHDAFGLAVMIFQLLFVGKHPFMGRLPNPGTLAPTIGENIVKGNYFYDERARKLGLQPPPASLAIDAVTPAVARLFELAFRGGLAERPAATAWTAALGELERSITTCRADAFHRYRSGMSCPWCAIELHAKIAYFAAPTLVSGSGEVDDSIWSTFPNSEVERLWATIAAVEPPNVAFEPVAHVAAVAAPIGERLRRRGIVFSAVLCALIASAIVVAFLPTVHVYAIGDALVTLGYWMLGRPSGGAELAGRRQRLKAASEAFDSARAEWQRLAEAADFQGQVERLAAVRNTLLAQRHAYEVELAMVRRSGEEQAKRRYLDSKFIRDVKIKGVGRHVMARLAAWNIETALDIDPHVYAVAGIGRRKAEALLEWRGLVERQFRFDPRMLDGAVNDVKMRYVQQRKQGRKALLAGEMVLRESGAQVEARAPEVRAKVARERELLSQFEADMKVLPPLVYR
jgi:DNA-binding helix-hairpin-helix protein with protein kinase domain